MIALLITCCHPPAERERDRLLVREPRVVRDNHVMADEWQSAAEIEWEDFYRAVEGRELRPSSSTRSRTCDGHRR